MFSRPQFYALWAILEAFILVLTFEVIPPVEGQINILVGVIITIPIKIVLVGRLLIAPFGFAAAIWQFDRLWESSHNRWMFLKDESSKNPFEHLLIRGLVCLLVTGGIFVVASAMYLFGYVPVVALFIFISIELNKRPTEGVVAMAIVIGLVSSLAFSIFSMCHNGLSSDLGSGILFGAGFGFAVWLPAYIRRQYRLWLRHINVMCRKGSDAIFS